MPRERQPGWSVHTLLDGARGRTRKFLQATSVLFQPRRLPTVFRLPTRILFMFLVCILPFFYVHIRSVYLQLCLNGDALRRYPAFAPSSRFVAILFEKLHFPLGEHAPAHLERKRRSSNAPSSSFPFRVRLIATLCHGPCVVASQALSSSSLSPSLRCFFRRSFSSHGRDAENDVDGRKRISNGRQRQEPRRHAEMA